MMYDKIVLTHEDIVLLSVLVGQQLKFDTQVLSLKPSRSKQVKLKEHISILSILLDKLNSIKSVTYEKK